MYQHALRPKYLEPVCCDRVNSVYEAQQPARLVLGQRIRPCSNETRREETLQVSELS